MRRRLVVGAVLAVVTVAGCANTQPGDKNQGAGYTNNVADLVVKIHAMQADPCRGSRADQLFPACGRYVGEVANVVNTLRAGVPSQATDINTLAAAVHTYQSLSCDSAGDSPSATQRARCPAALTAIGKVLDRLDQSLSSMTTSR